MQEDTRTTEQKMLDFYGAPTSNDTVLCGLLSKEQATGFLLSEAAETVGDIRDVRPHADPDRPPYLVVLRNMLTGAEHMHPSPLQSLDSWYMHFMGCDLFSGIDFSQDKAGVFPKLVPPKPDVDAFTSTEFIKQGIRFRARVVVAPMSLDWVSPNIVGLYVDSPPLPFSYDGYEKRFKGSAERTALLKTFAQTALCMYYANLQAPNTVAAAPAGPGTGGGGLADKMLHLQLQHGDDVAASANDSFAPFHAQGELRLGTVETSAGAVVIPAVLAKLHFLHLTLTGLVPFMVYPVSKFSYMVNIHDVGGWKVLMCVNMRASANAIRGFFERANKSPLMRFPGQAMRPTLSHTVMVNAANSTLSGVQKAFKDAFTYSLNSIKTPANIKAMKTKEEYFVFMQFEGLMMVISGLLAPDKTIAARERLQLGRAAVLALSKDRWSAADVSEDEQLQLSACKYYMCAGLAAMFWDLYVVLPKEPNADNFKANISTIPADLGTKNYMGDANQSIVKAVWKSWKDCPPSEWWRSICSIYKIKPIVFAHIIMQQKARLDPFFPERVFGKQSDFLIVDDAKMDILCTECRPIFEARENYNKMGLEASIKDFMKKIKNNPNRAKLQRDFIASGMGYAMLYGDFTKTTRLRSASINEIYT